LTQHINSQTSPSLHLRQLLILLTDNKSKQGNICIDRLYEYPIKHITNPLKLLLLTIKAYCKPRLFSAHSNTFSLIETIRFQ